MEKISQSVVKKDHEPKMSGRSVYVGDYADDGILTGKFLRSKLARAKLLGVEIPELPEGYYYVDRNDVPGDNNVNIVLDDTPVYARDTVEYIGEPIGMVLAAEALLSKNPHPSEEEIREGLSGNLCRCTGYNAIINAVTNAAKEGNGLW